MANTQKPKVTKKEIEHAHSLWANFTVWMKWGVISAVVVLGIMALALV